MSFQGFRGGSSAGLPPELLTFIPLEDVAAGPGFPFDSSPAITVERDVFPAGKGFDLAGDVDSCHLTATSGEKDGINVPQAGGRQIKTNKTNPLWPGGAHAPTISP